MENNLFFFHFSTPRIKHYKVMSVGKNYTIELEKPVSSNFLVFEEFSPAFFQIYLIEFKERWKSRPLPQEHSVVRSSHVKEPRKWQRSRGRREIEQVDAEAQERLC